MCVGGFGSKKIKDCERKKMAKLCLKGKTNVSSKVIQLKSMQHYGEGGHALGQLKGRA